jgi:hypothetical protein
VERDERATGDAQETRFLPPEPPDADPELTPRPAKQPEPPPPPPPPQQTYGYPPQPPGAPGQPAPGYQQPWGQPPQPVPDNGQAVAGFVLSVVALGLLVISFGLSTIVSLGLAIGGIVCSHNGKRRVDAGETPKHRGLAQAGFVVGWVSLGLSVLAIVAWILVLALGSGDDQSIFDPDTTRALREAVGA